MPLEKSASEASLKRNIKTLMGEVGSSPHVQSRDQALAIAYSIKRRWRAEGGLAPTPWQTRAESRSMMHTGPISSIVPGRTDRHNMNVPSGSYVMPADAVSHLGQNNSMAGLAMLSRMFGNAGPFGGGRSMAIRHGAGAPRPPGLPKMSSGGMSDQGGGRGHAFGQSVPVKTAGGEFVVPVEAVRAIGNGDVDHGHKVLDRWVLKLRADHRKTLKNLPPPAKN